MSEFFAEKWTNEFGQDLTPGDNVVAISTGYSHSVGVRQAIYLGVRKNSKGIVESVTVNFDKPRYSWSRTGKSSLPLKRVYALR